MSDTEQEILTSLQKIENMLSILLERQTIKDWYSTTEIARILGKAVFTVRGWCRLGRIVAEKKKCGRGIFGEWVVSQRELERIRNEGLRVRSKYRREAA